VKFVTHFTAELIYL